MTATIVVLLGLVIGYWVVSLLFKDKPLDSSSAPTFETPSSKQDAMRDTPTGTPPWHEVLEVSPSARADEIRTAYRRLMSQYHPDKVDALGSELKALAERKTKQIQAAHTEALRSLGLDA